MKKTIIFIALFFPGIIYAGNCDFETATCSGSSPWTADSPSYADVNYCINTCAQPGDMVNVPSGSAIWSNGITLTKGIVLIGAGAENTMIKKGTSDALFLYNPSTTARENNDAFRISGFNFDMDGKSMFIDMNNKSATVMDKNRIDHNIFANNSGVFIERNGPMYGVMDNNVFTGSGMVHMDWYGTNSEISWSSIDFEYGSGNFFFVEDNVISTRNTVFSGGWGGSWLARYNTITHTDSSAGWYPAFDMHGNQPSTSGYDCSSVGPRGGEMYGNLLISGYNKGVRYADHRGGQMLIFFNRMNTTGSVDLQVREEYSDLDCYDGKYTMHVNNSYYFNNRKNGISLVPGIESSDYCDREYPPDRDEPCNEIEENREFWNHNASYDGTSEIGIYCGPTLPGSCVAGDGAWITAQSCSNVSPDNVGANPKEQLSGTLYKCVSTNTWEKFYTPYAYPHPLRNESGEEPPAPAETCSDGIRNQDETGVDCGGVCPACPAEPEPEPEETYDLSNFIALVSDWLGSGNSVSDVNNDGIVNTRDLGIIMSSWSN